MIVRTVDGNPGAGRSRAGRRAAWRTVGIAALPAVLLAAGVLLPAPDGLIDPKPARAAVGPPAPGEQSGLTVEQMIALLKVGYAPSSIIRDVRAGSRRYKLLDDQYQSLKGAGAPPELLDLLTGEKAEPLSENDLVAIAREKLTDAKKSERIRWRPLGFQLDDAAKLRLITAVGEDAEFARNMGDLITLLSRRAAPLRPTRPDEPAPAAGPRDPPGPVVVTDITFDMGPGRVPAYTFTIENRKDHAIKNVRLRVEYFAKFSGSLRNVFVEEAALPADLNLEAFEKRRLSGVRLHRSAQPAKFSELRITPTFEPDDRAPVRFVRWSPKDVERAVLCTGQVGFLDTAPFPEWNHRFTLINRGAFAVKEPVLLLRLQDKDGRTLWFHQHAVGRTLMPGDVTRESIGPVDIEALWDRKAGDWRTSPDDPVKKLEPARAELVLLSGYPVAVDAGAGAVRTLDVVAPLLVAQTDCSWIGPDRKATNPHHFDFTVVNPHPFAVKDVVIHVRFRDAEKRSLNYEAFLEVRGPVGAMEARRFRQVPVARSFGLITEGDRAGSYEAVLLSATPVEGR